MLRESYLQEMREIGTSVWMIDPAAQRAAMEEISERLRAQDAEMAEGIRLSVEHMQVFIAS